MCQKLHDRSAKEHYQLIQTAATTSSKETSSWGYGRSLVTISCLCYHLADYSSSCLIDCGLYPHYYNTIVSSGSQDTVFSLEAMKD